MNLQIYIRPLLHCGLKVIEKKISNAFNLNLEGWADSMKDSIEMGEYNDLIEKLNNKYPINDPFLELLYMWKSYIKYHFNK